MKILIDLSRWWNEKEILRDRISSLESERVKMKSLRHL